MARKETARHKEAFEVWYANERNGEASYRILRNKGGPRTSATIYNWERIYEWDARADERDALALEKLQKKAIEERAKRIEQHANLGKLLQSKGGKYLQMYTLGDGNQAIRAITEGVKMERQALGIDDKADLDLDIDVNIKFTWVNIDVDIDG